MRKEERSNKEKMFLFNIKKLSYKSLEDLFLKGKK